MSRQNKLMCLARKEHPEHERQASEMEPLLPKQHGKSWRPSRKIANFLVLGVLVWSFVLQAEACQELQAALQFNRPFFMMCYTHSAPAVLLPLLVVYHNFFYKPFGQPMCFNIVTVLRQHTVIPLDKLFRIALALSAYYCVLDCFYYTALPKVSVAAATSISNCTPLFVYCLSICFLRENVKATKIIGVLTSFVGVIMVVIFQNQDSVKLSSIDSADMVPGLFIFIAAALYAGYEVGLRFAIGEEITDTPTLLTLAGLIGILTIPWWIGGSIALAMSPYPAFYEPFGLPTTSDGLLMLFIGGVFSLTLSMCLPLALCWTSPLETSVACMLTIPLAGLLDTVVHHTTFSWECIVGSVLVISGFGLLEYGTSVHSLNVVLAKTDNIA